MAAVVAGPLPNFFMAIPGDPMPSSWQYFLPQDGCWEEQPGLQQMQNGAADSSPRKGTDLPAGLQEVSDEDLAGDGYEYAPIEFARIGQALVKLIDQLQRQLLMDRQRLYAIHRAHQVGMMVSSPKSASQAQPQFSEQDMSNDCAHQFTGAFYESLNGSPTEKHWPEFVDELQHIGADPFWDSLQGWQQLDPAVSLKASGGWRKQSSSSERSHSSKRSRSAKNRREKVILEEEIPMDGERTPSVIESPYIAGDIAGTSMEEPEDEYDPDQQIEGECDPEQEIEDECGLAEEVTDGIEEMHEDMEDLETFCRKMEERKVASLELISATQEIQVDELENILQEEQDDQKRREADGFFANPEEELIDDDEIGDASREGILIFGTQANSKRLYERHEKEEIHVEQESFSQTAEEKLDGADEKVAEGDEQTPSAVTGSTTTGSPSDPCHEDCSDVSHTGSMNLTHVCQSPTRSDRPLWADVQDDDPDFFDTPEQPETKPKMCERKEKHSEKDTQRGERDADADKEVQDTQRAERDADANKEVKSQAGEDARLERSLRNSLQALNLARAEVGTEEVQQEEHKPEVQQKSSAAAAASEDASLEGTEMEAQQKQEDREEKDQRQDSEVPSSDKSRAMGATSWSQIAKLPKSITGGDAPVRWVQARTDAREQAKTDARDPTVRKSASSSSDKRELPSMDQVKVLVSGSWAGTRGEKYEIDLKNWTCVKQNKDFYNTYKLRMSEELGVIYWQSSAFVLHLKELKNDPNHVVWRGAADGCVKWVWTKQKIGNMRLEPSSRPRSSK